MSARNSRPCSRAHAAATYATDHCTTLRRRSLVQMLWSSRSAGVSFTRRPPCRGQCSGIRSGAGVNGRRQAQALRRPTRWLSGCQHRLSGQGLEASASRNPAAAVAGSERESASWESGNLGSCRAFADSPGCQDSRFSVPRPGGDLGGRDRGRGARVRAATWRTGNLEPGIRAARRGAGRRGPAGARSGRVGRTRAAAMASPMARRRASLGRRDATSEEAHAGARESVHRIGLARSLRNACNRRNTRARRGGRRRIEYAREPTHTVLLSDHYCMRYPVDAHRPNAVASLGEQAARTHEGTDSHGPAVTACSHRAGDLPAPEHARLAAAATGRRERPRSRVARLRRRSCPHAPRALRASRGGPGAGREGSDRSAASRALRSGERTVRIG